VLDTGFNLSIGIWQQLKWEQAQSFCVTHYSWALEMIIATFSDIIFMNKLVKDDIYGNR